MPRLSPESLPEIQRAIADAGLDGWLLYDFRGTNPIARDYLGMSDVHLSRRIFVLVPRAGVAIEEDAGTGGHRLRSVVRHQ